MYAICETKNCNDVIMQQYAEREKKREVRNYEKVAETRTDTKSDIGQRVIADGTRWPSVSRVVSSSRQISRDTKKEMTRSSLRYRVDSSADHINSTAGTERQKEDSYRSSDFTADIIMATGYSRLGCAPSVFGISSRSSAR